MSWFGDSRYYMNELISAIGDFFEAGGTLEQLFEILQVYFEYEYKDVIDKGIQ